MDEMSSLDSYQTTEDDTAARPPSAEADAVAVAEDDDVAETDAVAATDKDEAAKEDDEDFDEISDGTFEVDDSSQVASNELATDDGPTKAGSPAADRQTTGKTISPEEVTEQPTDTRDDSQKSADFEEVSAEVTAEAIAEESDLLGDADATLPAEKSKDMDEEDESEAEKASTPNSSMDVDHEGPQESSATEMYGTRREEEAPNDETEPMKADESIEEGDKNGEQKDAIERRAKDADDKEVEEERDAQAEHDAEGKEPVETDADKNNDPSEVMDVDHDDDVDHEDEPVENVQEPEESDNCIVPDEEECLIPDDDAEVTEADKEQAILARENAEKALEQAEKERQKDSDLEVDSDKAKSDDKPSASGEDTADKDSDVELVDDRREKTTTTAAPTIDAKEIPQSTTASEDTTTASAKPASVRGSSEEPGEDSSKTAINWIVSAKETCVQCKAEKTCDFRFADPDSGELSYLCQQECCDAFVAGEPDKYCVRLKKFLIEEVAAGEADDDHDCMQCKDPRPCKYFFRQDDLVFYVCSDDCFGLLNAIEPDKFQLKRHSIRVRNIGGSAMMAATGKEGAGEAAETHLVSRSLAEAEAARHERAASFVRRCADCLLEIELDEKHLQWETLDFCNEQCLGKFQRARGSSCETCGGAVSDAALGKYCVRFGFDVRQFCCAACLNEYKKGLKTCSCCQKDISSGAEGFLAPVGDKEQFKDFCSQACMRHYDAMCNPRKKVVSDQCAVCNNVKPVQVEIVLDGKEHTFCSNPCFSAFKFVSNIVADQCGMCSKYFERKGDESFTIYMERRAKVFCTRICLNVYIITNRCIVSCQWCKVKKYNFDMIYKQSENHEVLMCSLNCLTLYGMSINAFTRTVHKCDNCSVANTPQYHLTMSDASMRNFCTYQCVMQFQSQFGRTPLTLDEAAGEDASASAGAVPFPTGLPKRVKLKSGYGQGGAIATQSQPPPLTPLSQKRPSAKSTAPAVANKSVLPIISNVASLASGETSTVITPPTGRRGRGRSAGASVGRGRGRGRPPLYSRSPSPPTAYPPLPPPAPSSHDAEAGPSETRIITVPPYPPTVRNVQTSCRPQTHTFGCQTEPATTTTGMQTEKDYSNKVLIPVPVPIFIPTPMYMYSAPFPVPVPIPLPIPVPVFIPTTRNSAEGILKEIKKIQDKMPADPFEAELLMMAEMVAEEKNEDDSDSGDEVKPDPNIVNLQYTNSVAQQPLPQQAAPQHVEVANHSYGEDVLQMALKMATGEYDQPTVDLETAMQANTITNPPPGIVDESGIVHIGTHHIQDGGQHIILETPQRSGRGRKRGSMSTSPVARLQRSPAKRARISEIDEAAAAVNQPLQVQPTGEKPDANLCLKYTFGVNAWKQWVMTKNTDIEKNATRRRPFKTELLQMTADELNYSLCLFVKEVRKPNGTEYAPDTIYYLVLGIQQYLYENGRIDNIFTDVFYERFTDCLDEVARRFSVLYNDSQYIVTRVEEEHLWECKQLGAHSPHVLLSTLMFFNTKHFNLTTVEEHMQLSFSHIMKHWKRSSQNAKNPGTRNVLLRFYPPQAGLDTNPRKKKVYEQQENEENPLRCPVRLYEFYLSKCPESVKTRNDVFYLQPERSCVPDSPVWYSTQALSRDSLEKMLHRVKMVKEINIALLTS